MSDEEVIDRILFRFYEVDPGALYVADFCIDDLRLDYPPARDM
ncbi:hypothetical protein SAMN05421823_11835 [Catalinimonas alkaloidigena]|uniref:Uncharacterized protein n=1 Tax=Catalinimonas alkaloidigena TaxID=1075417 RepID=A0A1G9UYJ5_9BACT|nr:hypothetical protein SAMN05421823_11835 [Catalinimonas alkaloidigena]